MKTSGQILLRLILIVLFSAGAYYVAFHTYFWMSSIWLLLVVFLLAWDILRIHRRAHKDLQNFLLAIAQHEFNTTLPPKIARDYPSMARAYETINEVFQEISLAGESSQSFLEVIVEQVGVALIGFRTENGEIRLINKVAKDLLDKVYIRNIAALRNVQPELYDKFMNMTTGERSLLTLQRKQEKLQLSVVARELVLEGYKYKLFAIQNIRSELEEKEIDSWIRLIRVLTHEIKNSAIPIATLSEVVSQSLTGEDGNPRDTGSMGRDEWDELFQGLRTIQRRSRSLVNFIETYSKLTKLPEPDFQPVNIHELLHSVTDLLHPALVKANVSCEIRVPEALSLKGDVIQLEQVLINLVKNAIEAADGPDPRITLTAEETNGKVLLRVNDNGPGMDEELLENIFIPFYTTKTDGTGIGLSISRQIIRAHHGELKVTSAAGTGTAIEIILPALR